MTDGARIVQRFGTIAVAGEMQGAVFQAATASQNLLITCLMLSFGSCQVRAWDIIRGTCFGAWLIDAEDCLDKDEDDDQPASPFQITQNSSIMIEGNEIVIFGWDSFIEEEYPWFYIVHINTSTMLMKRAMFDKSDWVNDPPETAPDERFYLRNCVVDWPSGNVCWPSSHVPGTYSSQEHCTLLSFEGQVEHLKLPESFRSKTEDVAQGHFGLDRWFAVRRNIDGRGEYLQLFAFTSVDPFNNELLPLMEIDIGSLMPRSDRRFDDKILGLSRTLLCLKCSPDWRVKGQGETILTFDILNAELLSCPFLEACGLASPAHDSNRPGNEPVGEQGMTYSRLDELEITHFMLHPFLAQGAMVFNSGQRSLFRLGSADHYQQRQTL